MDNILYVSVDLGYGYVKGRASLNGKREKVSFPSVIKERKNKKGLSDFFNSDNYIVDIDTDGAVSSFFVGEKAITDGAIRSHSDKGDFNENEIRVFLLTAVHVLIKKLDASGSYEKIDLQLGLPIGYSGGNIVDKLIQLVINNKAVVTINKISCTIKLTKPNIYMQGIGAYYDAILDWNGQVRRPDLATSSIAFIMIGYKTVELLALRKGISGINVIEDLSGSLDLKGFNILLTDIQNALSSKNIDINVEIIERAILHNNNELETNEGTIDISSYVEKAKLNYVEDLSSEIKRKWGTSEDSLRHTFLAGASAQMLFDLMHKKFKTLVVHGLDDNNEYRKDASIYANANGYLKMRMLKRN